MLRVVMLAAASLPLALPTPAHARTWHITPDGLGDAPTIRAGADSAAVGDTVLAGWGTYRETGIVLRPGTVLKGEDGPPGCVTIDSGVMGSVILARNLGSSTRLEGLTITGGVAASGAALRCYNASLTVADCTFTGNSVGNFGGAVFCDGSSPTFTDCTFSDNQAGEDGGGVACYFGSSPVLTRCDFAGNSANWGGGLYCWFDCSLTVIDCTFFENTARADGGGMTCYVSSSARVTGSVFHSNSTAGAGGALNVWSSSSVTMTHCTLVENTAGSGWGSGVACAELSTIGLENTIIALSPQGEAVSCDGTSGAAIACSDVFGNASGDWVNCIGSQGGTNRNHAADPLFCDPDQGDLRLQWGSLCLPPQSDGCGLIGALEAGNCPSTSVEPSSWARIKVRYR